MDIEKKQFIIPRKVAEAVDRVAEEMGGKGQLKRIGAASLLMFLHAQEEDRAAYILWADAIAMASATIEQPPIISRLVQLGVRRPTTSARQVRIPLERWHECPVINWEEGKIVEVGELSAGRAARADCVPILDPVAGGKPIAPKDGDHEAGFSDDFVLFSCDDPLACGVSVEGRYMMSHFPHGTIVVVSPKRESSFRSGMLGVVVFADARPYVFRLVKKDRKRGFILRSLCDGFADEIVPSEKVEAVYPVVLAVTR